MTKYGFTIWAALAVAATTPAFAQETPAAAKAVSATSTMGKPGGAVSSSYARCVPGNGDGSAADPATEGNCSSTNAAEGKDDTQPGSPDNAGGEPAQAGTSARDAMPSRLSMTPTTTRQTQGMNFGERAEPPVEPGKNTAEKAVPTPPN